MLLCSFMKKKTGRNWQCFSRLLSCHFPMCFDHVLSLYPGVQSLKCIMIGIHYFDFSQGHVTENQSLFS